MHIYIYNILHVQHTIIPTSFSLSLAPQITLAHSPAPLSLVSQSNLQGVVYGVYQQGGDMLLDTRQLNTSRHVGPLYWRLPPEFEGNQVLSQKLIIDSI